MKNRETFKISPVNHYHGAAYPTARQLRRRPGRISKAWKYLLSFSLGLGSIFFLSKNGEAVDEATWTVEPQPPTVGITHPFLGIYHVTACFSGPIWDPMTIKERIALVEIVKNPAQYRNEIISTEGRLQAMGDTPFGEVRGYGLADNDGRMVMRIIPQQYNPVAIDHRLVGQPVRVVGEFKLYSDRYLKDFVGFTFNYAWGIALTGIEPLGER